MACRSKSSSFDCARARAGVRRIATNRAARKTPAATLTLMTLKLISVDEDWDVVSRVTIASVHITVELRRGQVSLLSIRARAMPAGRAVGWRLTQLIHQDNRPHPQSDEDSLPDGIPVDAAAMEVR